MHSCAKILSFALLISLVGCAGDNNIQDLPSTKSTNTNNQTIVPSTFTPTASAPVYGWVSGAFGACSATCGAGTQARTVSCIADNGSIVADSFCTAAKPAASQACSKACTWQPIPQAVANGLFLEYCSSSSALPSPPAYGSSIAGTACTTPGVQCWSPGPPSGVVCQ